MGSGQKGIAGPTEQMDHFQLFSRALVSWFATLPSPHMFLSSLAWMVIDTEVLSWEMTVVLSGCLVLECSVSLSLWFPIPLQKAPGGGVSEQGDL